MTNPSTTQAGVVLIAAGFIILPWALGVKGFHDWVYLALVLLVVACPCALVLSTPIATACGLAAAAKMGLLIKGGNYLEVLARLKVIAFDKTGTLTEGAFTVVDMQCIEAETDLDRMLYWISSLENQSSHPMATALVDYARIHGVEPASDVKDFQVIPGEGISGFVNDRLINIGNARLAYRYGWTIENQYQINKAGLTIGYVGIDEFLIGFFLIGDQIRKEAANAIKDLKEQGIEVIVLTGDSEVAAELIKKQIGNTRVHSGLAPAEKVKIIAELKSNGITAMVGDGINDAPALAAADLGIAMGVAGSAVAMETADVALMSNDLTKIAEAIKLGKRSLRKVYQNVVFSLAVKLVFFGLTFAGIASLWAAVAADMGTCLVVIFNSMLLLKNKKKKKKMIMTGVEKIEGGGVSGSTLSNACNAGIGRRRNEGELREPLLEEREGDKKCCSGCCSVVVVVEDGGGEK